MSQLFTSGGQSIGVSAFNIRPSSEYPGLISFRMDWLDLLAVQANQSLNHLGDFAREAAGAIPDHRVSWNTGVISRTHSVPALWLSSQPQVPGMLFSPVESVSRWTQKSALLTRFQGDF